MTNKKFILFLCFIILILSLNTISATTQNNSDVLKDDYKLNDINPESINQIKEAQDNAVYVNVNSDNTLEDGSKDYPYKTISNENLEKISTNSTIFVSKGTYNINPTTFDKDISIVGEDQKEVIFVPNSSLSVFTIEKYVSVSFKNFTLKDFESDSHAAITNNGNLIIENLDLLNNVGTTSSNNGGSILNNGNLDVINTTFNKNTASFGAAIYSTANVSIYNSSFIDNNIYNVGGAIYSARGNLTVYDSYFTLNRAVSGAAIYSAFGNLYVNNTSFIENSAESFFGGAIYSTGFATTENCEFNYNFAVKDGGAITNTNNFTIINCSFIENFAGENGGAIENVPWTEVENGNLTIINSTFCGNGARKGGVIINYGKIESVGEMATVTARNSLFELNSASEGGVIYNEQYVDFENCVFIDNEADEYNVISSNESLIKSINNNWWGTNNPNKEDIGAMPETWIILKFTNTTPLIINDNVSLQVSLNTLNDGRTIDAHLPERIAIFSAENSDFSENELRFSSAANNTVKALGDELFVEVDYQKLSLIPGGVYPTDTIITINPVSDVEFNKIAEITGKLTDNQNNPLYNTGLNVILNGKSFNIKTDATGKFTINTKATLPGENNITVTFKGNDFYASNSSASSYNVVKRNVSLDVNEINEVYYGQNITVNGLLKDSEGNALVYTRLNANINGRNISVKTNSFGQFNITTKAVTVGENNWIISFEGNDYYNSDSEIISFNVLRQGITVTVNNISDVRYGSNALITGKLTDCTGNGLYNTHVDVSVDGRLVKVKTDSDGTFTLSVKLTKIGTNTVNVSYRGNDYYASNSTGITCNVIKRDVEFIVDSINNVSSDSNVSITGKLVDNDKCILYNTNIQIKINENLFKVKTNNEGEFLYSTDKFVNGINSVIFNYVGNDYFNTNSTYTTFYAF